MDSEYFFVASPGALGVRTNARDFKWSFGVQMPPCTRAEYDACALRLRVEITRDVPIPSAGQARKYHYWLGRPGEDVLYYDRAFALGSRLRLAVTGLLGDEPTLKVNPTYYRYISHRFMNLHSVGYLLTDLAAMLLLRKGIAPLHCSAFRQGTATVVVAAPPNTGKTLTAMKACLEHGSEFIAEDLALTDGRDVLSVPWTSTFRYYREIDDNWRARVRGKVIKLLPAMELLPPRRPKPVTEFVAADRLVNRSRVTHVVLLEQGPTNVRAAGIEEACRKLSNLNCYEFNYRKAPLIVAYEYFNPEFSIDEACRTEASLIQRLVENCDHAWVASSNDPTCYAEQIIAAIAEHGNISRAEHLVA